MEGSSFFFFLYYNSRTIWSFVSFHVYHTQKNKIIIFTADNLSVTSFLSVSNTFLIVFLLDPPSGNFILSSLHLIGLEL